jgi:hypothetical protein
LKRTKINIIHIFEKEKQKLQLGPLLPFLLGSAQQHARLARFRARALPLSLSLTGRTRLSSLFSLTRSLFPRPSHGGTTAG